MDDNKQQKILLFRLLLVPEAGVITALFGQFDKST